MPAHPPLPDFAAYRKASNSLTTRRSSAGGALSALGRACVMLMVLCLAPVFCLGATYPDLPAPARPEPEPAYPAGFELYQPPVGAQAPDAGAPAFAEWTRTARPGHTVAATGHQFSQFTGADFGKDTSFVIYGQSVGLRASRAGEIQRLDAQEAAFTLSGSLPDASMYLVWAGNANGYGYPVAVNRTELWWVGPNAATRGARVSVYGRNLSNNNGTTTAWVYIKPMGAAAGQWAAVSSVNPYKVEFTVPDNLINGAYEVWAHNGHGGRYGWSGPVLLNVEDGQPWAGPVFNVRDYGAKGDGAADDEAAIQAALSAASKAPGSTVLFPAGVYMVSKGFNPPSNVRWRGEGKDATVIKLSSGFVKPADDDGRHYSLLFSGAGTRGVEIRDLTLDANGNLNGYLQELVHLRGAARLRFFNVAFKAIGYKYFDFHKGSLLQFAGCDFIGVGGFWGTARQVFVDGSAFLGTNDANTLFDSWGGEEISITNSSARDYDNTKPDGWAQGRFVYGNGVWGSNRKLYAGNNKTEDLSV
ncbi:MAG TPA: glycosyl hydrolase family 28-related protein, partial [Pyrinomonadaceae bacterium]|nr:glycosyl hydrolase family 28-related protein [Pyrinomonadaceae bacterium]